MVGSKRETPTADEHYLTGQGMLAEALQNLKNGDEGRATALAAMATAQFSAAQYVVALEHAELATPASKGFLRDAKA